jgi:hypothetical protein
MSEQTAIKDNPASTSGGESEDALDNLLNEFEQKTEPQKSSVSAEDIGEVVQYVKQQQVESEKKDTEEGIKSAVDTIKEGLDVKVPDRAIRGMLFDLAESNEGFVNAFNNRNNNPQAWNKVLKSFQKEVAAEFQIDPEATNDREALKQAVHSSKSETATTDEPVNFAKMSDSDFQKALIDMGL